MNKKLMRKKIKKILDIFFTPLQITILVFAIVISRIYKIKRKGQFIVFGSTPIINYSHWCGILRKQGYAAKTYVDGYFRINSREDWDFVSSEDLKYIPKGLQEFVAFSIGLIKFNIFVISCDGFFIGSNILWRMQNLCFKLTGSKTIVMTYGGDSYIYSQIKSNELKFALNLSYPEAARNSVSIEKKVRYWEKNSDIFIAAAMTNDGFSRIDLPTPSTLAIDTSVWKRDIEQKKPANKITIAHAANHRGFKGTHFIKKTVEELVEEGLPIEFILLENKTNKEIRRIFQSEVDILIEQIFFPGYALTAIEAMSCGIIVLGNIPQNEYTKYLEIWSFLGLCPIVKVNQDNLKDQLLRLIKDKEMRDSLAVKSRIYVEKYHSANAFIKIFEALLEKIQNSEFDLRNYYINSKNEPKEFLEKDSNQYFDNKQENK